MRLGKDRSGQFAVLAGRSERRVRHRMRQLEQNMAAHSKEHIVPGKQLHANGPNYRVLRGGA